MNELKKTTWCHHLMSWTKNIFCSYFVYIFDIYFSGPEMSSASCESAQSCSALLLRRKLVLSIAWIICQKLDSWLVGVYNSCNDIWLVIVKGL